MYSKKREVIFVELEFFDMASRGSSVKKSLLSDPKRTEKINKGDYLQFGRDYYDNKKDNIGYCGYTYDGRFYKTAKKIIKHYGLQRGARILEIGCAKGFLLVEFLKLGMDPVGLELSKYSIDNCHPLLKEKIKLHDVGKGIPFEDNYFDFIISKEAVPHLPENKIEFIFKEMQRTSKNQKMFHEIQCGMNEKELQLMKQWDPTHQILWMPNGWNDFFKKINYQGDHHFKVLIEEGVQ